MYKIYLFKKYGIKIEHLNALLGLYLYFGIEKKSNVSDYWSLDPLHSNNFVPKIMSKFFYIFLSTAFHLHVTKTNDNNEDDDYEHNDNEENSNGIDIQIKYLKACT